MTTPIEEQIKQFRKAGGPIIGIVLAAIVAIVLTRSYSVVKPGYRGVKVTFGKVSPVSYPSGIYLKSPIGEHFVEMNVRTQRLDEKTETYTKDVQDSTIEYTVNYHLDPVAAASVYSNIGPAWVSTLLVPRAPAILKDVVGHWDAVDFVEHRDKVARTVAEKLKAALAPDHIIVTSFQIRDIQYTQAFQKSVEDKVIAQQRAIEEQNRTAQIQQQADQKLIRAKAEAESMQIRAKALESNPKLVQWEAVQKWNGVLPQYMLGGSTPFINLTTPKK